MVWNKFDLEVSFKAQEIRDYGDRYKYDNYPGHCIKSFKAQALVELAANQILEEEVRELKSIVSAATDVIDCDYQGSDFSMSQLKKLRDLVERSKLKL